MQSNYLKFSLISLCLFLTACANKEPPGLGDTDINYGDEKAVETVTNEFGSTDLQIMAEKISQSLLNSAVLDGRPIVTIANTRNKTSEYIDTTLITDTIRKNLLKSGRVKFGVDVDQMSAQSEELRRQESGDYDQSTTAKRGNMVGAEYRLEGSLSSIVKNSDDYKDVYYKLSLQMVHINSGLLEWADEVEIRKTTTK